MSPTAQHPGLYFATLPDGYLTHRRGRTGRAGVELYFATLPDGYLTADEVVKFLRGLLRHRRGNVIAVWDRGPHHQGPAVRELLKRNRRLRLEMPPPYAPERNPVEQVWGWLTFGQLANFVPGGLAARDGEVIERLVGLRFEPGLLRNLWAGSDLPLPKRRRVKQG